MDEGREVSKIPQQKCIRSKFETRKFRGHVTKKKNKSRETLIVNRIKKKTRNTDENKQIIFFFLLLFDRHQKLNEIINVKRMLFTYGHSHSSC